ncbi:uncharacterized protein JCM10292_005024 [Rhodotorula paludigena]|uniref:uncharacterized protein n=1 Tax=Rhodotorula paludigena TaxID=86838 RepID=UPI00317E1ACA
MPSSRGAPTLPAHLVKLVVDNLDIYSAEGLNALACVSRSSRTLRSVALPRLHGTLVIYGQRAGGIQHLTGFLQKLLAMIKAGSGSASRSRSAERAHTDPFFDRSSLAHLAVLEADRTAAALVKDLTYFGPIEGADIARGVKRCLRACPSIEAVWLQRPGGGKPDTRKDLRERHHAADDSDGSRAFDESSDDEMSEYDDSDDEGSAPMPLVLATFHEVRPNLERLAVRGLRSTYDGIASALESIARFQRLQHLSLSTQWSDDYYDMPVYPVLPSFPFRLRSLSFGTSLDFELFIRLTANSHASLVTLEIAIRGDPIDLAPFINLEYLVIRYADEEVVHETLASAPRSIRVLELRESHNLSCSQRVFDRRHAPSNDSDEDDESASDSESLERLRRRSSTSGRIDEPFGRLLRALPPQIQRLSLAFALTTDGAKTQFALLDVLALPHDEWLPDLRVLDVGYDREWEAEAERKERRQLRAERRAIASACKKRGIRLGEKKHDWEAEEAEQGSMPRKM